MLKSFPSTLPLEIADRIKTFPPKVDAQLTRSDEQQFLLNLLGDNKIYQTTSCRDVTYVSCCDFPIIQVVRFPILAIKECGKAISDHFAQAKQVTLFVVRTSYETVSNKLILC